MTNSAQRRICEKIDVICEDGLFIPAAEINSLRRAAAEKLIRLAAKPTGTARRFTALPRKVPFSRKAAKATPDFPPDISCRIGSTISAK
ncbi:MAG: DUF3656 domain-containing protein [Oscillospiraceae bacterium]